MYKNYKRDVIDPKQPYLPEYYGIFEQSIAVGGKTRRMLTYIPEDVRASTAGLLVLGENGKTADELLNESGWKLIAEQEESREKMIVFFLEPENGAWDIHEPYGKLDGDVAYIDAAALKAAERTRYCVHESKLYLMGCREGGVLANMAAAWNPTFFAGVVSVGGSAASPEYLAAAKADYCTRFDGFEDIQHRKGIRKGEIPMPAWVIDDPAALTGTGDAILHYWREACGTAAQPRRYAVDTMEYFRTKEAPYAPSQDKEAYRVWHSSIAGASEADAQRMQRRIWKDFLYQQRRWMSSPEGDLRVTHDPVNDLSMEYHYEEIDGWMREWYVYIPEAVKRNPNKKAPLVFAMHGYTCSGEIYAGNSEWFKVADKYGCIVVHPSALSGTVSMPEQGLNPDWTRLPAWNIFEEADRPDELRFFNILLDHMLAEYPVDEKRVFATGHSWGSLVTQMLAMGMSDRLTAVVACSGVFFGDSLDKMLACRYCTDMLKPLPIWMFWGMEEEWLIPTAAKHDNQTGRTLDLWMKRNQLTELIPTDWADCTYTENGRFFDHRLEKNGCAPVWYTRVDYMPHATMTEMSFRIWEEFFSQF